MAKYKDGYEEKKYSEQSSDCLRTRSAEGSVLNDTALKAENL
jgi:hypothetical protein